MILEGFAGPGGFSEALRMLGLPAGPGIEFNRDACATAEAAGYPRICKDIRTVDPADYIQATGWASGSPCPTFAAPGKRTGNTDNDRVVLDGGIEMVGFEGGALTERRRRLSEQVYAKVTDQRTGLVLEALEFALELPNLRWIVLEQVPAVGDIWMLIAAELAANHRWESVSVLTLHADDFGAPTTRKRTWLAAARDYTPDFTGVPIRKVWQTGQFDPPAYRYPPAAAVFPHQTLAGVLGWPAGVKVNTRGNRETPGGNLFSADKPSPSLTGKARSWYRADLGDPEGRLTAAQAGLLQGFPPDYPWQGSRSSQFQQAADTVCPLMGAAVIGATAGLSWEDAVRDRIDALYGNEAAGQLDLFQEVAA